MPTRRRRAFAALVCSALAAVAAAQEFPAPQRLAPVRAYIKKSWDTLTRSTRDLARAAPDPKFPREPGKPWPVYLSAKEDRARVEQELAGAMSAADRATVELKTLPADPSTVTDHGLLYVPHPYVVPGGRFNEMYGWDSYFILVGLLRDGEVQLAKDMVENFL